jgi:exopolysaccharide biosynthesis protein
MVSLHGLVSKVAPHLGFIYLALVLTGITATVYIVNQTMQSTDPGQGTVTKEKATEYVSLFNFDTATVNKIRQLTTTSGNTDSSLPSGRINPFSESVY